jgi:hypothetical protein
MINGSKNFIDNQSLSKTRLVILIATINLLWAVVDGLLLIFTNLLEKGRDNKIISTIKSSDKNLATQKISNELNRTTIKVLDQKDKVSISEIIFDKILLLSTDTIKKHKILLRDIWGSVIVTFFCFFTEHFNFAVFLIYKQSKCCYFNI